MDYATSVDQSPPAYIQTLFADDTTTAPATTTAATTTLATNSAPASSSSAPDYSGDLTGDWFGVRPKLQNAGITFGGSLVTDGSWNLSGGIATNRSAYQTLLNLNVSFDLNQLFGLQGGTFFVSYEGLWGQNGNTTMVGSLQGYDNNSAPEFNSVYQLYYDQKFGDPNSPLVQLRVGRQDAGDFFAQPPDAAAFINPSPTTFPTLIGNALYPNAAPAIAAVLNPNGPLIFKFGAYYFDRLHPTAFDQTWNTLEPQGQTTGTFLIAEADYNWQINNSLPGVVGGGGTWRTGQLATLNGSTQSGAGS